MARDPAGSRRDATSVGMHSARIAEGLLLLSVRGGERVCVCERERERASERNSETETETDRQTDRQTERGSERERRRERERARAGSLPWSLPTIPTPTACRSEVVSQRNTFTTLQYKTCESAVHLTDENGQVRGVPGLPVYKLFPRRSAVWRDCVKSLRSSYTGLHSQR